MMPSGIICIVVIHSLIYITDVLDGKIARRWMVCSKKGEVLDVIADLGYMTSQYCIFIITGHMPFILLVCIYVEFFAFVKSSLYYRPLTNRNFLFNKIGKIVAGYYYSLPLLYTVAIYLKCNWLVFVSIDIICIVLTSIAIWDRVSLCQFGDYDKHVAT